MEEKISCCGLNCLECGAYRATAANDDKIRIETAKEWSQMHQTDIKPEDINCKGCTAKDGHFDFCTKCELRLCATGKGHDNCAHCKEYDTCKILAGYAQFIPQGKARLDQIKSSL